MSFHATYNPHLLAPPTQRHPHHHNHPHNRITQNAQASESTTSLNTGLRAKLRSALELQKHAHFDVKINIHEISNVPQLQGEFCCHWHFRGKSPKVRDGGAVSHKPSLPNLKFTQARHQESTSTASLPVRSVSDDKAKPHTSSASTSQAMKGKSFSTPPFSLSVHSLLPTGKHKSVDKKRSDPTPLRNSLLGSDLQPVESPVSAGENEDTPTASSSMVGRDSASSSLYNPTSTAASSTSYLSIPVPTRHSTDESRSAEAPIPIERSSSRQTMSKSKSTNVSTHRNGVTPNKPLDKNHTCTWDQEINVSIRIPISKGDGTVGKKPILGEGPKSHSGLKLEIQQLPTHITHPKHNEEAPHPHPPTHAHAQGEKDEEESGKHEKNGPQPHPHPHPKGKPTAFGRVHIDLAAFAGRGRTTRKFLLKGSRTNATVQITVEMNFVGGDRDWVAPPLVEGHHVAARMKDIVGGRDTSENIQKDLQLTKTPSQSSTGSSISQGNSSLSRNPSSTNPGPSSRSYPQYKSYHHHLLSAQDAKLRTPTASASTSIPRNTLGQDTTTPNDRRAGTPGLGHEDETEISVSPSTPTRNFWNHRHRHGHGHLWKRSTEGIGPRKTPGIKEIDSLTIIEAIFNPAPGRVEGPFTYVPDVPVEQEEEELRGEAEHHESLPDNGEVVVGKRMGWRRRKTERKDTVSSVMSMGSRTVSGATSSTTIGATATASARNPSPVRGGRGVSPGRIPRIGSSHAIRS